MTSAEAAELIQATIDNGQALIDSVVVLVVLGLVILTVQIFNAIGNLR